MPWVRGIIVLLALAQAGWMLADGSRALVLGDYFTFGSRFARPGQELGPWSQVVALVGIDPRSTTMKCIFVAFGLIGVAATFLFIRRKPFSRWLMLVVAIGSLWYLGVATPLALTQILLLILLPSKDCRPLPATA